MSLCVVSLQPLAYGKSLESQVLYVLLNPGVRTVLFKLNVAELDTSLL